MAALDCASILLNITMLAIAIFAILIGFKMKQKPVRLFGLTLSLVDVASLVLFNIDYSNSIQFAGGIILCGVLCFAISFIYSKISKTVANLSDENDMVKTVDNDHKTTE
jgi:xanthine/uracil permease